jgi:hypothetical protein
MEHLDHLSEDEQKLSKYLDNLINSPSYKDFEVTIQIVTDPGKNVKKKRERPNSPKDRRTRVFEKLEALLSEQVEALRVLRERTGAKKM